MGDKPSNAKRLGVEFPVGTDLARRGRVVGPAAISRGATPTALLVWPSTRGGAPFLSLLGADRDPLDPMEAVRNLFQCSSRRQSRSGTGESFRRGFLRVAFLPSAFVSFSEMPRALRRVLGPPIRSSKNALAAFAFGSISADASLSSGGRGFDLPA